MPKSLFDLHYGLDGRESETLAQIGASQTHVSMADDDPVPHMAIAIDERAASEIKPPRLAILAIQTGDHVETFTFRTESMTVGDFGASITGIAEQILGPYMGEEKYQRRLAAQRGVDRPVRPPVLLTSGPLFTLFHRVILCSIALARRNSNSYR